MSGIIAQNILDNSGLVKAPAAGGAWNFIKKLSASSDSALSFVTGSSDVDLTSYKEYIFTFKNIHPETQGAEFTFNGSDDDSSHSYDVIKTVSMFATYNHESSGETPNVYYNTDADIAQSTAFQILCYDVGADNDQGCSGYLHLFNPSSTTFVKHFITSFNSAHYGDYSQQFNLAGYFNDTDDITALQFKFSSGDIDTGDICLYGIS